MLSFVLFAIVIELRVSLWGGWLKQETGIDSMLRLVKQPTRVTFRGN